MREIVCVTPPSASGSGASSIKLFVDKAEVVGETRYIYTEDPTISNVEPNWSIIKYENKRTLTLVKLFYLEINKLLFVLTVEAPPSR